MKTVDQPSAASVRRIHKPQVLAIIPARGGSKGIPRKNIVDLCGKPLIAYSIEVALKSRMIDRVVVSTDDQEIASISKRYGAEVPFLRPKELATDRSKVGEAIEFTFKGLRDEGYKAHILVTLYPTHPFRTPALIDELVQKTVEGFSPVRTVKSVPHTPLSIFSRNKDGCILPLLNVGSGSETQIMRNFYRHYGLFSGEIYGSTMISPYLHVVNDPISLIDIDSFTDLFIAEQVISRGLFDFEHGPNDACDHTDLS